MPRRSAPSRQLKNFPTTLAGIVQDQGIGLDAVELWFADEARVGQKNKITCRWARRGTKPSAPQDQRTASTYIFGAFCPREGKGAALVLPFCNSPAMSLHLQEIATMVSPGRHAVLLLDQAGWRLSGQVEVPANITLLPLPPKCPELNVMEDVWQFMRDNWLSNHVFPCHDAIVDLCCDAWRRLTEQPWRIMSIGTVRLGTSVLISGNWYEMLYQRVWTSKSVAPHPPTVVNNPC